MRYSEWIADAGRHLFRNTNVWVLIVPLLLLIWVLELFGGASVVGIQGRMQHILNDPLLQRRLLGADTPGEILSVMASIYTRVLGVRLPFLILSILLNIVAWVFTLIVAGAVIHQTMPTRVERPRWQESLHVGLNRAIHIFAIRLGLALPFVIVGLAVFFVLVSAFWAYPQNVGPPGGPMAALLFGFMCVLVPFMIVWGIFVSLFEPLALQACVQDMHNAWEAIRTAWKVFWRRLGPVIVLGVIVFVIRLFIGGFSSFGTPIMMVLQFASGGWALFGLMIWAAWGMVVAVLNLGVQAFGWILYAQAWPDLKASLDDPTARGTTDAMG